MAVKKLDLWIPNQLKEIRLTPWMLTSLNGKMFNAADDVKSADKNYNFYEYGIMTPERWQ